MLRSFAFAVAFTLSASLPAAGQISEREAKQFFDRYNTLGDSYDADVADLYSDNATIRTYRRYPHGLERSIAISGHQWKILLRMAMPLAKAQNDRSEYKELQFQSLQGRMKITAKRYSVRKCYWDPNYYMIIEKQANGTLEIVEEYSETQPQSGC